MKIYINGEFYDTENAKISVFDHGLLYGDGIFEGIRLYKNCLFKLNDHITRLQQSAKSILLHLPWSSEEIAEQIVSTCRINKIIDGYVRVIVTRGRGNLSISPKDCSNPQLIIIADQVQAYPQELYATGLRVVTVPTQRVGPGVCSANIKTLNGMNKIMAKIDAEQMGYLEAIMLNDQGYVTECTGDNIFIYSNNKLLTPHSHVGAIKGVTRETIMEIGAELGVPVEESHLTRYDLWNADECFLTGTAVEMIPVIMVDGRTIGAGNPGPTTTQFMKIFQEKVCKQGYMIKETAYAT